MWVMLSQPNCNYCSMALALLASRDCQVSVYDVSQSPILKNFLRDQGITLVPQIYHKGLRVGGYEDLRRYLSVDHA